MTTSNQVAKLYNTVVEDVINNVKEAFLDEGVDEQVLQELKQLWENKLASSKALEPPPQAPEIVLAPSAVPVRMPQPLHPAPANAASMDLAGAQAALQKTQTVQGATAQASQPVQYKPSAAAQSATMALPAGMFRQHLATIGADGQIQNITVQQTGNGQYITLPQGLPQFQARQPSQLQAIRPQQQHQPGQQVRLQQQPQHIQLQQQQQLFHPGQLLQQRPNGSQGLSQLDGGGDTSSSDDDDDFDVDEKDEDEKEEENEEEREEEEPLNSADDVSEEDPSEIFETDNVVVCQYDKINRNKNKWKFHLKDGIMNLNGRDFVFQKATGDSEW